MKLIKKFKSIYFLFICYYWWELDSFKIEYIFLRESKISGSISSSHSSKYILSSEFSNAFKILAKFSLQEELNKISCKQLIINFGLNSTKSERISNTFSNLSLNIERDIESFMIIAMGIFIKISLFLKSAGQICQVSLFNNLKLRFSNFLKNNLKLYLKKLCLWYMFYARILEFSCTTQELQGSKSECSIAIIEMYLFKMTFTD